MLAAFAPNDDMPEAEFNANVESAAQLGCINALAAWFSVPEEALRLMLTLLAGYPTAAFYRLVLANNPNKSLHHLFFATSGLLMCYFNYGIETYHSLLAVLVTYVSTAFLQLAPTALITTNFVFHMGYLVMGYYYTASSEYDILWTMPQCIIALRMIGYSFDVADNNKTDEMLSKDQQKTVLRTTPTLLQLMAYAYFPSSFLVGPQYPYRRYQSFVDGEFQQYKGNVRAGMKRLLIGLVYLAMSQFGSRFLPNAYFLSDVFRNKLFIWRLIYLGFWGKFTFYKYISCWLITEGALMSFGLTYNGQTASGRADWSGCTNVRLMLFETGNTMEHYIHSFNINTNHWVAQYIYKRLKFMNNRNISYGATLAFLAVWHGLHSGYYMTFLMEYLIVTTEKQITNVYTKAIMPKYGETLNSSFIYRSLEFIALKSYNIIYMGWCLIAFVFLKYERWLTVMGAVHYFGFIYMLLWAAIFYSYKFYCRGDTAARKQPRRSSNHANEQLPSVMANNKQD